MTSNRHSLYLDFYPAIPNPKTDEPTRREFLGLYLYDKPKTPFDKQHNKETQDIAEQIRQRKDNQLNKPEIYTGYEKEQLKAIERGEKSYLEYFNQLANKRKGSNRENWLATYRYLSAFAENKLKFSDLNQKFFNEFREYLLTTPSNKSKKSTLTRNSAASYFNAIKTSLKQAYKDDYLVADLNSKVEPIKEVEIQRNYLTIEEMNALQKTECRVLIFKQAALFSALTGLRYIDIENLVWGDIEHRKGDGYSIRFMQQKTKNVETMPISDQAFSILGKGKEKSEKIFEGLKYSAWVNKQLKNWVSEAGISKKITFHCFRHTFATLQLSYGTDIYTVSKMLGHRGLRTTQIYAKVIDQTKREASNKIKLDFNK